MSEKIISQYNKEWKKWIDLRIGEDTFKPNTTTYYFIEKVIDDLCQNGWIKKGYRALELGCGTGIIAMAMVLSGAAFVDAVDIMPEAVADAQYNILQKGLEDRINVYQSDLYQNVSGQFDIIFADVSAMSKIASKEWYGENIPCGGSDGTENIIPILKQASKYLNKGGVMYFPVIGLSDSQKIYKVVQDIAGGENIKLVAKKSFPFSEGLKKIIPQLEDARKENIVNFYKKRSRFLWDLEIVKVMF